MTRGARLRKLRAERDTIRHKGVSIAASARTTDRERLQSGITLVWRARAVVTAFLMSSRQCGDGGEPGFPIHQNRCEWSQHVPRKKEGWFGGRETYRGRLLGVWARVWDEGRYFVCGLERRSAPRPYATNMKKRIPGLRRSPGRHRSCGLPTFGTERYTTAVGCTTSQPGEGRRDA